jgi:hypothetical protein
MFLFLFLLIESVLSGRRIMLKYLIYKNVFEFWLLLRYSLTFTFILICLDSSSGVNCSLVCCIIIANHLIFGFVVSNMWLAIVSTLTLLTADLISPTRVNHMYEDYFSYAYAHVDKSLAPVAWIIVLSNYYFDK